ncbi:MAG: carbamoyl-phosphate synthase large subunit [Christensenellales bacterium]
MPKRNDIEKVLLIGSGPDIIGQGSEYDIFLNQSLRAFREMNIETVIVNSDTNSTSTDIETADVTYIEPLDVRHLTAIILKENPTAVVPVFGGQKALNLCSELIKSGILEKHDVKVLGISDNSIELSENRVEFKKLINGIKLNTVKSNSASSVEEAEGIAKYLNFPVVVRPAFTIGGYGGGLVYNIEELRDVAARGIAASLVRNILIEQAILGWKEIEAEVLRDISGNVFVAGIIENVDPMGVHTGDSVTVIPPRTLSDKTINQIKEASVKVSEALNVCGIMNIQFAYDPSSDTLIVKEANLRASRTTALISKAAGLPIAEIATKLIMGIGFDEISVPEKSNLADYNVNYDYVTVKVPSFSMEKFNDSSDKLGTQMKSVGETMAIGSSFYEAFNKAFNSLAYDLYEENEMTLEEIYSGLRCPSSRRYYYIIQAFIKGGTVDAVNALTGIDKYYLKSMSELVNMYKELKDSNLNQKSSESLIRQAKVYGFSDAVIARCVNADEDSVAAFRKDANILPAVSATINYSGYYLTYKKKESETSYDGRKVIILGGGAFKIGQGSEYDYAVVRSAERVRKLNYESIIINSNPATVSTDTTIYNKVYFEAVDKESVREIINYEKPSHVLGCFGGYSAYSAYKELYPDESPVNSDAFEYLVNTLDIKQPKLMTVNNNDDAQKAAQMIGYPVIVSPKSSTGGRGMRIIHESEGLRRYMMNSAGEVSIEKFLTDAVELEVDAVCSDNEVFIPTITEHIEYAGIHSGDSDCLAPATEKLDKKFVYDTTIKLLKELKVKGIVNIKYALADSLYLININFYSSRMIPMLSKITGIDIAGLGVDVLLSESFVGDRKVNETKKRDIGYYAIKAAVFPFEMFIDADPMLGPEMRSTGSVLGLAGSVGEAFYKAQAATDTPIPVSGTVMISVDDSRKKAILPVADELTKLGFTVLATSGTYNFLTRNGVKAVKIDKMYEGRPNIADAMINHEIDLLINTPSGIKSEYDDSFIRKIAIRQRICYITTVEAANAAIMGIKEIKAGKLAVRPIQLYLSE